MIRPIWLVVGVLFASVFLSGCEQKTQQLGGIPRTKTVEKIVSLSPSTTEVVTLNTASTKLVGRTESCDSPGFIKNVDVVVKGLKPDYERIAAMQPDLVAYDESLFSAADVEKLKEMGAPLWPYNPKTLNEYEEKIVDISQKVKDETQGSKVMDLLYQAIGASQALIPKDTISVAMLTGGGGTEYMAAGTKTLQSDLSQRMGLIFKGPDSDQFSTVNVEQILAWNPTMIVTSTEDAEKLFNDPRLGSLDVVKNKRVFGIEAGLFMRAGTRLDKLVSIMKQQADRIVKAGR